MSCHDYLPNIIAIHNIIGIIIKMCGKKTYLTLYLKKKKKHIVLTEGFKYISPHQLFMGDTVAKPFGKPW